MLKPARLSSLFHRAASNPVVLVNVRTGMLANDGEVGNHVSNLEASSALVLGILFLCRLSTQLLAAWPDAEGNISPWNGAGPTEPSPSVGSPTAGTVASATGYPPDRSRACGSESATSWPCLICTFNGYNIFGRAMHVDTGSDQPKEETCVLVAHWLVPLACRTLDFVSILLNLGYLVRGKSLLQGRFADVLA